VWLGLGRFGVPVTAAVPKRRSWLWLQGLVCGAALSFATAPAMLLVVLLLPGLVAYVVERTPGKPISESMLLLGLATTFTPLRVLWEGGHTMEACIPLISDPARLGLSWMAAASGWLMYEAAQMIARQLGEHGARRKMNQLRKERAELVTEWGPLEPVRTISARR
jgi:hypothetical protein